MAGTLQLSYADLQAAIIERRFPSSSPVAQWLAAAYSDVWNAANWTFKRVRRESLVVSSATPTMPAAFANATDLYDDQGCELKWMSEHEFDRRYASITSPGRPEAFTVVNRQIILGPAPNTSYTFTLSYKRRLATRTGGGAVQAGFFVQSDDIPLWDDHHYLLVLRAKLIGLRDRSDPTASDLEGEYVRLLAAMQEEYVESTWGRQLPAWR